MASVDETLHELIAQAKAGQSDIAIEGTWRLFDAAPGNQRLKLLLLELLKEHSEFATPDNRLALQTLLNDPAIDPREVAPAGWKIVREGAAPMHGTPEAMAHWLEVDDFGQNLLRQTYVADLEIEIALTAMRRWLLLSGRWHQFPRTTKALVEQAAHNGGSWLFDNEERTRLDECHDAQILEAFRPRRPEPRGSIGFAQPTTDAVARQYESWPYPHWTRVTRPMPTTLATVVQKYDPGSPDTFPVRPKVLVAGCGTGSDTTSLAFTYPDAQITAIDISRTSLDYATERCSAAGLNDIEFHLLPLERVAELGQKFDAIFCFGVLHHLPDPEAGWAALSEVLEPGGVMCLMVYSKLGRLLVRSWQRPIADLLDQPVSDNLLREVRRRLIESGRAPTSRDFFTMGGVHDLLLHRHEDPFDVERIRRNIEGLRLQLLRFELPSASDRANYRQENPQDPLFRDYSFWAAYELRQPLLFAGMYRFWCRKPVSNP